MKQLYAFSFFSILLFISISLQGQVTIGSGNTPQAGTLLDLTEGEVTRKGLNLPRVSLKSLVATNNDLRTTINGIDTSNGEAWELEEHAGLVIYNVNEVNCTELVQGVYVWEGDRWSILSESAVGREDLYLPNCYVVPVGSTNVIIPVKKAFAIWEYYGWDQVGRLPSDTIKGNLTASLYWEDEKIVNNVTVSGNTRDDKITVTLAGGTAKGNAVIALKDGDGVIRWSWHIWLTDDPTSSNLVGNGMEWMDRFLGATSSAVSNPKSIGLLYQWGRKDPFPGYSNFSGGVTAISGEVSSLNTNYSTTTDRQQNLKRTITTPIAFIKATTGNFDWYSYNETDPSQRWDDRWSKDECGVSRKSPFDPCPQGWKVPSYEDADGQFPWHGIGSYKDSPYWVGGEYGYTWTVARGVSSSIGDFGYYPATGYRSPSNGALVSQGGSATVYGINGYAWTANSSPHETSTFIGLSLHYTGRENGYTNSEIHTWGYNANPSFGFPIRCIKD